jgi:hypothetical protein
VEKHVCLSRDVEVANVTRQATTRIEAGVGDLVWRIRDDQAHVGYLMARRSGGRVMLFAIHIVHVEEIRSMSFLI